MTLIVLDGEIRNGVATAFWLVTGGGLAHWFYRRREDLRHMLYGEEGDQPPPPDADYYKFRLVKVAFLVGGIWLLLFLTLDWLF